MTHKATVQSHGNKQYYVHVYNEHYQAMEELGPYFYFYARTLCKEINEEAKAKRQEAKANKAK